ncbi:MAG: outer membrane beta-barrel protein [Kiritimatiellaeota bacterium]|nr:outer membrane beta-barrel protein [Kiritimatiellota bacterium]
MRHRLTPALIVIAGCLATTLPAQKASEIEDGLYVAFRGAAGRAAIADPLTGGTLRRESYGAMPSVGYRFTPYFRTELEYAWRTKRTVSMSYGSGSSGSDFWDDDGDDWDLGGWWDFDLDDFFDNDGLGSGSSISHISADYRTRSIMAQGYFDLPVGKFPVKPFVNLGLGFTHGKVTTTYMASSSSDWGDLEDFDDLGYDDEDEDWLGGGTRYSVGSNTANSWRPSWNAGVGFSYYVTDRLAVDAMYRYSELGKFKVDTSGTRVKIKLNEALVGVRFAF